MAFNNAGIQAAPLDAADEPGETFDRAVDLRRVWACVASFIVDVALS